METVNQANLKGKKVLLRVDFNVPMEGTTVTDDKKILETIPTIQYLIEEGASVIIISHLGRPEGKRAEEFSLKPVSIVLEKLLKRTVLFIDDIVGDKAQKSAQGIKPGQIIMLQNLRFMCEEEKGDKIFAQKLSKLADIFVQDAFANAHRNHASMVAITEFLPSYAGLLFAREYEFLTKILANPKKPLLVVAGGKKLETKVDLLRNILRKADIVITGGGIANTFLAAEGYEIGASYYDEDYVSEAEDIMREAHDGGVEILLPDDVVVTRAISDNTQVKTKDIGDIGKEDIIGDIGENTLKKYSEPIKFAGTIFWNGPVGIAENESFASGTKSLAKMIGESEAVSVMGGGDTVGLVSRDNLLDKFTYVSTGGGASMEFLTGNKMPAIDALNKSGRGQ